MKNKKILLLLCLAVYAHLAAPQTGMPADPEATPEAVGLLHRLQALQARGVMYGHQDDLLYGYSWRGIPPLICSHGDMHPCEAGVGHGALTGTTAT